MIVGVRGTVRRVGLDHAIIGAGPVDLRLAMPLSALTALPPAGSPVALATFLYVREDVLALYGFLSEDDLALFQHLLAVQGVGPRLALNLLSVLPAAALRQLLAAGDEAALARVPGIGKRTAARLVLDLQERLGGQGAPPVGTGSPPSAATALPAADDDLVAALVGWGFRSADAVRVLALPEIAAVTDPGARLAAAAARLAKGT